MINHNHLIYPLSQQTSTYCHLLPFFVPAFARSCGCAWKLTLDAPEKPLSKELVPSQCLEKTITTTFVLYKAKVIIEDGSHNIFGPIIVCRLVLSVVAKISIVLLSGFDLHFGFTLCRFTHHLHCAWSFV